jgi:rare lipoprotein A
MTSRHSLITLSRRKGPSTQQKWDSRELNKLKLTVALGAALIFSTFDLVSSQTIAHDSQTRAMVGEASWYGGKFHGRTTANGETYDMDGLTAAHRSLPFGSRVRVTNQATNESVVVRINDRGPFVGNRVIDLSRAAAKAVRLIGPGVAPVRLEVLASAG